MIITLKGATFTNKLDLNSWMIISDLVGVTSSNTATKVTKGDAYTTTFTINEGYTLNASNVSVICNGATQTLNWSSMEAGGTATLNVTPTSTIYITIKATSTSGSGSGDPVTPTNYTFTINPTPTSATVTLSATGYTTVSGTGSKSITVANGTKVNWTVSASGYTTRTGNWTISGGNKTESIALTASSGSDANDITSYVVDGKAITNLTGTTTMSGFFTIANYPVKEGSKYSIPYGRNGYFSNASGVTSTAIFQGGGSATYVTPAAPAGTTMVSVCFKHEDIDPANVTITEKESGGDAPVSNNPDAGVTTTSYGGEVKAGYMVNTSGALSSNTACNAIDMIPVKPATTYQLVEGCRNTAVLDSAGEIIKAWSGGTIQNNNCRFTTTADTAYMRTCYYWNDANYPKLSAALFTLTEVTE